LSGRIQPRMTKTQTAVNHVPCGDCSACCQGDLIFLHPELGDNPKDYDCKRFDGRWVLRHKDNKDCIYLDRDAPHKCTIYGRRPAICRSLDCRILLMLSSKDRRRVSRKVLGAARRLVGEHGNPWAHLRKRG